MSEPQRSRKKSAHDIFRAKFYDNKNHACEKCNITEAAFQEEMREASREMIENLRLLQRHMEKAELANTQRDRPTSPASIAGPAIVAKASSRCASLCERALAAPV